MDLIGSDISILHAIGYILLAILMWKASKNVMPILMLSATLILLHGVGLLLPWFTSIGFEFGLSKAIVWIMWLASVLVCCEAFFRRMIPRISAPVFLATGIATLLETFFPSLDLNTDLSVIFRLHILIAMLSYACLFFTSIRAFTINFQENSLRDLKTKKPDLSLPSLIELDASLHRLLLITFLLLSGTVMSGVIVNLDSGNTPLVFDHKTFFSLLAWLLISCIVAGKFFFGWRGRMVAKMTMIGCFLVILSYLGTQFVIEIILT